MPITEEQRLKRNEYYRNWRKKNKDKVKTYRSEEYYENVSKTNIYMYDRITQTHEAMQRIDRLGAFEKDDEAGTTFQLLAEVIQELKEEFDATEEETK